MYLAYCRFIGINTLEGKRRKQDFSEGEDELDPISIEASTAPLGEMSRWVDPSDALSGKRQAFLCSPSLEKEVSL